MKSAHFLPAVALACLATASLCPRLASAADTPDDPARKTAAEEVLTSMKMEAIFDTTIDRMMTMVDRISDNAAKQLGTSPAAADFQQRMHAQTRELLKKQFNWEVLKPDFVQAYAETFTGPELKELATFYKSPLGEKLVEKQPILSEKMGKLSQDRARNVLPQLVKMVQDEAAKVQPAAAPGAGPSGAVVPANPATTPVPASSPSTPLSTPAPAKP